MPAPLVGHSTYYIERSRSVNKGADRSPCAFSPFLEGRPEDDRRKNWGVSTQFSISRPPLGEHTTQLVQSLSHQLTRPIVGLWEVVIRHSVLESFFGFGGLRGA